jgi:RNA polymerase sigma-70 factor (ECF subfamily)
MHTTQPSLLLRLRQPEDTQAWERFVGLYTPLLFFWARRVNLPMDDARDLVQDVFAVLLENMADFEYDQSKSFRSWLRGVTMNMWKERLRKKKPQLRGDQAFAEIPVAEAEQEWDAEYQSQVLHRALEIMKTDFEPKTWKACWEHIVEGRSARDIAAELGLTENAVYLAKGRVLRRLREELAGMLD